jgi:hypothetical protein
MARAHTLFYCAKTCVILAKLVDWKPQLAPICSSAGSVKIAVLAGKRSGVIAPLPAKFAVQNAVPPGADDQMYDDLL